MSMSRTTKNLLIDESIALLQSMNAEDCADAIEELRNELYRVAARSRDRLATIAELRRPISARLEDELEDSLSPAGNDGLYGAYLRGELD